MPSQPLSQFANFLAINHQKMHEVDLVNHFYQTNSQKIKQTVKQFWKEKTHIFYQEARFWKWSLNLVFVFWWVFSTIGLGMIGVYVSPSGSNNVAYIIVGVLFLLLAYANNWGFIAYFYWHKPSFHDIVLLDTKFATNLKAVLIFLAFGFTSIIGRAIFLAVLKETILLVHTPEFIAASENLAAKNN